MQRSAGRPGSSPAAREAARRRQRHASGTRAGLRDPPALPDAGPPQRRAALPAAGDLAPHLLAAADRHRAPGRRHGLDEEEPAAAGRLPVRRSAGLTGVRGEASFTATRSRSADRVRSSRTCALGVHQGVGDQLGDDQQGGVQRPRPDAPGAQGARGEAAGVHDGVGQPPHRPALPERPGAPCRRSAAAAGRRRRSRRAPPSRASATRPGSAGSAAASASRDAVACPRRVGARRTRPGRP